MMSISLERINAKSPYVVEQTIYGDFVFQTRGNVIYGVAFLEDKPIGGCETYQLTISNKNDKHGAFDPDVKVTILAIIEEFFRNNSNVLIYICDTSDGREAVRNRLFLKWFEEYAGNARFYFQTAQATIEGEGFFAAIIAKLNNPRIELVKQDFERTASELSKP